MVRLSLRARASWELEGNHAVTETGFNGSPSNSAVDVDDQDHQAEGSVWTSIGKSRGERPGINDLLPNPDDSDLEILKQRNESLVRVNKSLLAAKDEEKRVIDYLIRRLAKEL